MSSIFLKFLRKNKFLSGIISSVIASALILLTALDLGALFAEDVFFIFLFAFLFLALFMYYVHEMTKNDKK